MNPKFKRGDILEPIDGNGSVIRINNFIPGYKYDNQDGIYETEYVEFIDGECVPNCIGLTNGKYFIEKYYKLCTKATRHKFIKDILQ